MGDVNSVTLSSDETGPDAPESVPSSEGIPEKFRNEDGGINAEALLSSYQELEKNYHGSQSEEQQDNGETEAQVEPEEQVEAEEQPEQISGALDTYSQEFFETGELKDESFEALENLGYPRDLVTSFIEGQKAIIGQEQNKIYDEVGGPEAYSRMAEWASVNMTDNAKEAYNDAVQGGNIDQAMLAVRGLRDSYHSAEGIQPNLLEGRASSLNTTSAFRSTAELVKAMRDPRYKEDAAYRKDVEDRLKASSVLGS